MIQLMIRLKRFLTWQKALAAVGVYFSLLGFFTFPLFIMEESIQVAQGGTWAAKVAKDWETMRIGCEMMNTIADDLHSVNMIGGWLNPFSFTAYAHYEQGTRYYVRACYKQAAAKEGKR
jgi:hypothetical protein